MNVKELIEKLKELPNPLEEVTISCDAEGNVFSPLARIELELNDKNQDVVSLYPQ